mgnify:CR=1 FL=1
MKINSKNSALQVLLYLIACGEDKEKLHSGFATIVANAKDPAKLHLLPSGAVTPPQSLFKIQSGKEGLYKDFVKSVENKGQEAMNTTNVDALGALVTYTFTKDKKSLEDVFNIFNEAGTMLEITVTQSPATTVPTVPQLPGASTPVPTPPQAAAPVAAPPAPTPTPAPTEVNIVASERSEAIVAELATLEATKATLVGLGMGTTELDTKIAVLTAEFDELTATVSSTTNDEGEEELDAITEYLSKKGFGSKTFDQAVEAARSDSEDEFADFASILVEAIESQLAPATT